MEARPAVPPVATVPVEPVSLSLGESFSQDKLRTPESSTDGKEHCTVYVDFESTRLGPTARILEIGSCVPGTGEFSLVADPEQPVDVRASKVHGKTNETLRGAPTTREALQTWFQWLKCAARGRPVVLVAHNGFRFDFPLLQRELQRCSCDFTLQDIADWFGDSLLASRTMFKGRASHALGALYRELFHHDIVDAHTALADCRALAAVCAKDFGHVQWTQSSAFCRSVHEGFGRAETQQPPPPLPKKRRAAALCEEKEQPPAKHARTFDA